MSEALADDVVKLIEQYLKKDKKIKRLNQEIIGLNDCIIEFHSEFCNKQAEINRLNNIIKEVRKYIDKNKASLGMGIDEFTCEMRYSDPVVLAHKVLEILDKENK